MTKIAVAVGSFIFGALSMLALGEHTSTLAQSTSLPLGADEGGAIFMSGKEPTVPPLSHIVLDHAKIEHSPQPLDGLNCESCTFDDVTFTYAGGAVRLSNPTISGPVRVQLKGAALNTVLLVQFLQAIDAAGRPAPFNPNVPMVKTAVAKQPYRSSFQTP